MYNKIVNQTETKKYIPSSDIDILRETKIHFLGIHIVFKKVTKYKVLIFFLTSDSPSHTALVTNYLRVAVSNE